MKGSMVRLNGSGNTRFLSGAVIFTLVSGLFLVFPVISCRRMGPALIHQPGEGHTIEGLTAGGGLELTARFPAEPDEISDLFHCFLPDSGVVPVLAELKNNDTITLTIHSSNMLDLPEGFRGFTLIVNGERFQTVHPVEVLKIIRGKTEPVKYRKPKLYDFITGLMLPPVAGYHVYKEVDVGRFYKPLLRHSLYPALVDGMLEPVILEPGEEAEGYLFFLLPPGENPYAGKDDSLLQPGADRCAPVQDQEIVNPPSPVMEKQDMDSPAYELLARACRLAAHLDTLPLYGSRVPHVDGPTGISGVAGNIHEGRDVYDSGLIFALKDTGRRWRTRKLVAGMAEDLPDNVDKGFREITTVSSKRVEIADASVNGRYAACALNFKVKSKVFLMDMGGDEPVLAGKSGFSRRVRRVFLADAGLFVITTDGFCRVLSLPGMKQMHYVRLGRDIADVIFTGEFLVAIKKGEGLVFYSIGEGNFLKVVGRQPVLELGREFKIFNLGAGSPYHLLVSRGIGIAGDTLKILVHSGEQRFEEETRVEFPGRVASAAAGGFGILVQLEDGTLLELRQDPRIHVNRLGRSEDFGIAAAAFLPFRAQALAAGGGDFTALGENGIFARGSLPDFSPCSRGVIKARVPVSTSQAQVTAD